MVSIRRATRALSRARPAGTTRPVARARTLLLVAAGMTALLAIAGAVSHGRPLSLSGRAAGPSATFVDYAFTTFLLLLAVGAAIAVYAFLQSERIDQERPRRSLWQSMLLFYALTGLALLIAHYAHVTHHLQEYIRAHHVQTGASAGPPHKRQPSGGRSAAFRWDELAVLAAVTAAAFAYLLWRRARSRPLRELPDSAGARVEVTALLDDAVDDLRNEQDVRRAIIAAYARMELALGAHGLARRRSEAPLEFLERALGRLHVSADAVRRLTHLFEWAKFSHHEPEAGMKDDAIDALLAVRDELRAPEQAAA
jgi:hypothetical protein